LTPIGTATALYLLRYGKPRNALLSTLWPDRGKKALGLPTIQEDGLKGVSKPEWVAVAVSSAFFGLAHYMAGGGWDVGKVSSAALAGTALAFIYLWMGIHASILLHWFFNYYSYIWDVAKMLNAQFFTGLEASIYVATLFLGFLGWMRLFWKLYKRLRERRKKKIIIGYMSGLHEGSMHAGGCSSLMGRFLSIELDSNLGLRSTVER
ncbi:MAG: CPBP family glutamic-type intramembrane protease, partial [Candidatus Bathyarchaeia archaeon]